MAVSDFYQFDVITNIKRVEPSNDTFPAITICAQNKFKTEFYENGLLSRTTVTTHDNFTRLGNFINSSQTYFFNGFKNLNVKNHYIDYFLNFLTT
jgi:hypothetical protein